MARLELFPMDSRFHEYLHDESGLVGSALGICFPESEADILFALELAAKEGCGVSIQGARTGLVGGAVPMGNIVVNLSRMKRIAPAVDEDGSIVLDVEPGVTHDELRAAIIRLDSPSALFWPPDPTETSATIGGAAACNSHGPCAFLYGRTGDHLAGARIVRADGCVRDGIAGGRSGLSPYIGGEGCTGVFSLLRLRLSPLPSERWGIVFFFFKEEEAAEFVESLCQRRDADRRCLAAVEFMDTGAMALLRGTDGRTPILQKIPDFPRGASALIYLEIHAFDATEAESLAEAAMTLAAEAGGDPDTAWAATANHEVERLREIRHAVQEAVNRHVAALKRVVPEAVRQAAEGGMPGEAFPAYLSRRRAALREAALPGCIFGHAGQGRLDTVLLPATADEYRRAEAALYEWAAAAAGLGGDIVGEYGIGRLRRELYSTHASADAVTRRQREKEELDPSCLLNPGVAVDCTPRR